MTEILLVGLCDLEVQCQALSMKDLSLWSFAETVEEVTRLEVARDSASGMTPCSLALGLAIAPRSPLSEPLPRFHY